jgi:small subunit ribosomal protein S2
MSSTTEKITLIDRLFKAGVHFGFKKSRRHPTIAPYLFTTKDGNDIFDLEKTVTLMESAKDVLREAGLQGKTVLIVGTKEESAKLIKKMAEKIETPYVSNRWIGGMLTNFPEIKKRINRLEALNHESESGELERKYTKKERVIIGRERDKLNFNFGGIAKMSKLPDLMLVVDPRHDEIAITEAMEKRIPVVAIMGSDCNAKGIKYPVVANDSLQTSVSFLLQELTTAYADGKSAYVPTSAPVERRPAPRTSR